MAYLIQVQSATVVDINQRKSVFQEFNPDWREEVGHVILSL
jgi:hypothetical protein